MAHSIDRWWTWRWDYLDTGTITMECDFHRVRRWRRGSFLTIYILDHRDQSKWLWFYGPFNLGVGFSTARPWVQFKRG